MTSTVVEKNAVSVLPKRAEIVEVGLRDGFQTLKKPVPLDMKLELIQTLIDAGVKHIQVTSFVHPKRVPQMADAEELCANLPDAPGVEYSGLVLNMKGLERALSAGLKSLDMGVAATESLSQRNANTSVAEGTTQMAAMAKEARAAGVRVRAGVQTAFGCAYEGDVPQARGVDLVRQTLDMDIDELALSDSTGMANPLQIERMLTEVRPLTGNIPIVLHLHDTRGMGLANVYAALRHGVTRFDTAFGGLGGCPFIVGAKGNIATEDTLFMMEEMGVTTGVDIAKIATLSRRLETFLNTSLPAKLHHLLKGDA